MIAASILIQPNPTLAVNTFACAYRQVFYRVVADSFVPPNQPMYADIYTRDGVDFYKTITGYSIEQDASTGNSIFDFDIQDACQEWLLTHIPIIPINTIQQSDVLLNEQDASFIVYFRGSTFSGGLLIPEPTIPTQRTATTPPISPHSGLPSGQVMVLLATMIPSYRRIYDNSSILSGVLTYFEKYLERNRVTLSTPVQPRIYPLSNLPVDASFGFPNLSYANSNWKGYNGGFPIYVIEFEPWPLLPLDSRNCTLWLLYGENGILFSLAPLISTPVVVTGPHTYYLPCGLEDIRQRLIAEGTGPIFDDFTDASKNMYYRIGLRDEDSGEWAFFSPLFRVMQKAVESECLWFQSFNGHFEQVTFVRSTTKFTTNSSEQFRPYTQEYGTLGTPPSSLTLGRRRYNIRANDDITLTATFPEQLMDWLKELFASGYILQQIPTSLAISGFRAVKILDGSIYTRKSVKDGRVNYDVSITIRPAIDYITLRN